MCPVTTLHTHRHHQAKRPHCRVDGVHPAVIGRHRVPSLPSAPPTSAWRSSPSVCLAPLALRFWSPSSLSPSYPAVRMHMFPLRLMPAVTWAAPPACRSAFARMACGLAIRRGLAEYVPVSCSQPAAPLPPPIPPPLALPGMWPPLPVPLAHAAIVASLFGYPAPLLGSVCSPQLPLVPAYLLYA